MTLEMRELKGDDMFTLLSIVGKLDIKDEFIKMFEDNIESTATIIPMDFKKKEPTKKEKLEIEAEAKRKQIEAQKRGVQVGANLLQKVLLNIKAIKPEINALLADLTGKTIEEVKNLNILDYTNLIVAFFKKEELGDFFSSIASLLV